MNKLHLLKLFDAGLRADGRKIDEYRKNVKVEYGVSKTAEGSAKVTIGETEVIVGIKLELGKPYPDQQDQGTMMVGAELLPLSSPEFEPGPPQIQAIELARVVDRGIRESKAIDFKKLCIKKGEQIWIVLIDICTINDAGNLFDAASLGALAALKDTRMPKIVDDKIQYKEKTKDKLPLKISPIGVTVCKIGKYLIVDPVSEEEKNIEARLTVTSIEDGTLCALQKGGNSPLTSKELGEMLDLGIKKSKVLRGAL